MTNLTTTFNLELALAYVFSNAEGESATQEQKLEAWAFLIKSSKIWSMKRYMQQAAIEMIELGVIDEEGEINWDIHEELQV
jgi:hypothetical protein